MRSLKVGFSYWGVHDGLKPAHQLDTPDGHRYGRPIFIRELLKKGHKVYALQKRREEEYFSLYEEEFIEAGLPDGHTFAMIHPLEIYDEGYGTYDSANDREADTNEVGEYPELDVIFMEWRWPTYKNDRTHPKHDPLKYEPDLDRQRQILYHYHGKIPIIIWDTDLKVTPEDEAQWPEAIFTDPSFNTNRLTRDRVSLPFWTDWNELFSVAEPFPIYGYIGNNYERPDEFKSFYFKPSEELRSAGIQTCMYGNWLQNSPERESPESLIRHYRNVCFNHRMNFYESMKMMNKFICTTHISKPRYYETGFMSPRYLEALAVGCPALVPEAFNAKNLLGKDWTVNGADDVVKRVQTLESMSLSDRKALVEEQKTALKKNVSQLDVKFVIDFIEQTVK